MKKALLLIIITVSVLLSVRTEAQVKNIVLVHGAFADASGWKKVYTILKSHGYNVSMVGNPLTNVEDDVASVKRVLDRQKGPVILVGHSYGGAIITLAGNSSKVAGLVYVAAFAPDEGESLGQLLTPYPPDSLNGILPPENGFVWYDLKKFHNGFCADLPAVEAAFMAASQVPVAASAFTYKYKGIAWKTKPSWHIIATEDHSLPTEAERFMAKRAGGKTFEIKGSHVIFISHAKEVADIIEAAAKGTKVK